MSDSDDSWKAPHWPSWQSSSQERPPETNEQSTVAPSDRASTIEQAKRFLQEDEVRNASTEKKVAFLESKGLQGDDIQELLGVERNIEASSTPAQEQTSGPDSPPHSPPPPPSPPPAPPSPPQMPYTPSPTRDAPPIITYPEFLTTPPRASPLITKSRLATTLYAFSALSFLLYGTSNYLVTPMLASLTTARLSLLSTASENLSKLVARLETMVSEIPPTVGEEVRHANDVDGEQKDEDSDSDPTELFHRDIGVQTSLPSTPTSPKVSPTATPLDMQANNLTGLKASIQSLVEENTTIAHENQELEATIGVLREYCDGLAFVASTPTYGFSSYAGSARTEEKDDEIARVKAGIRGVKGVLLSARSFPGGVRAGVR